jgi:hypothetical protein
MRAFYRGYHEGSGRRAAQVRRLHIMREDGRYPGRQALCGTGGYDVTHSTTVLIDPMPEQPPAGLAWCGPCVGRAAERLGQLPQIAARLAKESSTTTTQPEGTCQKCQQPRPLFTFEYQPPGFHEFVSYQVCTRCWSDCTEADERGEHLTWTDLIEQGTDEQIVRALQGSRS